MQLTGVGSVSTTIAVSAANAGELARRYCIWVMHSFPQWRTLSLETDRNGRFSKEPATIQLEKLRYTAKAHTTGGRDGTPGTGTNSEQVFAAGWPACFLSAIKIVAGKTTPRGVSIAPLIPTLIRL